MHIGLPSMSSKISSGKLRQYPLCPLKKNKTAFTGLVDFLFLFQDSDDRAVWSWYPLHFSKEHPHKWCAAAAAAKSLQSCPTLCDPIDSSPPGSPVPGILQARTLEWVAISFSNAWKWKVKVKSLSCIRLFATPWTAAYQAPLSMGFSRQEDWSGVPLPSPTNGVVKHQC